MPVIAINPIPGQEEENAIFLEKNNLAIWIKKGENVRKTLKNIINDDDRIKKIKENIKKFAKPDASKKICKEILK